MKVAIPAMILLLAMQAGAQNVANMGRLFTTPTERAQLDAQRDQSPAMATGSRSDAAAAGAATVAPGMSAATPCTPGAGPGCPALDPVGAGAAAPGASASAPTDAQAPQAAHDAPGLKLDGIIRRSHGPTVVIVNGEVQPVPVGGVMRGAVTLQADGRSVVLKPGQRYDPATGEIHEAAR